MPANINLQVLYRRIGKNIFYLRKEKGLTQEKLAEKLSIYNQSLISQYEHGKKQLTLEKITEFCDFFDVSLSEMLFSDFQGRMKKDEGLGFAEGQTLGPIKKCAGKTYYGYYIGEQNSGESSFQSKIVHFELDILNPISTHEAAVKLYLNGRDKSYISGTVHMDETYAYISCHDWEKDSFWHLTFYYHRKRQRSSYQGGVAMLQTLDFHLLPVCQLCVISINAISEKRFPELINLLKIGSGGRERLSNREFSSSSVLRLTKGKDKSVFNWLTENVKI